MQSFTRTFVQWIILSFHNSNEKRAAKKYCAFASCFCFSLFFFFYLPYTQMLCSCCCFAQMRWNSFSDPFMHFIGLRARSKRWQCQWWWWWCWCVFRIMRQDCVYLWVRTETSKHQRHYWPQKQTLPHSVVPTRSILLERKVINRHDSAVGVPPYRRTAAHTS